jgi:tRNA nucleotidyltransferase/poly(A) polymerase
MQEPPALVHARQIAAAAHAAGGRALIVGGWVRDQLMGREAKDVDLEVYGLEPRLLRQLLEGLGRVELVGESFQVYKLGEIDVSLPRRSRVGPRPPRIRGGGRSGDVGRRGGAAARLHD